MLKPTKEWIIVEVIAEEEKVTASGIVLPGAAGDEITKKVKLLQFGPDANPTGILKEGDIVLCMKNHGLKVEHEGKEYEFMKEVNFLGLVD